MSWFRICGLRRLFGEPWRKRRRLVVVGLVAYCFLLCIAVDALGRLRRRNGTVVVPSTVSEDARFASAAGFLLVVGVEEQLQSARKALLELLELSRHIGRVLVLPQVKGSRMTCNRSIGPFGSFRDVFDVQRLKQVYPLVIDLEDFIALRRERVELQSCVALCSHPCFNSAEFSLYGTASTIEEFQPWTDENGQMVARVRALSASGSEVLQPEPVVSLYRYRRGGLQMNYVDSWNALEYSDTLYLLAHQFRARHKLEKYVALHLRSEIPTARTQCKNGLCEHACHGMDWDGCLRSIETAARSVRLEDEAVFFASDLFEETGSDTYYREAKATDHRNRMLGDGRNVSISAFKERNRRIRQGLNRLRESSGMNFQFIDQRALTELGIPHDRSGIASVLDQIVCAEADRFYALHGWNSAYTSSIKLMRTARGLPSFDQIETR